MACARSVRQTHMGTTCSTRSAPAPPTDYRGLTEYDLVFTAKIPAHVAPLTSTLGSKATIRVKLGKQQGNQDFGVTSAVKFELFRDRRQGDDIVESLP